MALKMHPDKNKNDPNATKAFQDVTSAYQLLQGYTNDDMEATPACSESGGKVNVSHGAFAFPKGNEDFLKAFNAILDDFVGSDAHKALFAKHGMTTDEQPVSTTAELCAK